MGPTDANLSSVEPCRSSTSQIYVDIFSFGSGAVENDLPPSIRNSWQNRRKFGDVLTANFLGNCVGNSYKVVVRIVTYKKDLRCNVLPCK